MSCNYAHACMEEEQLRLRPLADLALFLAYALRT